MMRRREFLKTLAMSIFGGGIAFGIPARVAALNLSFENLDDYTRDYIHRMKNFNEPHHNDVYVDRADFKTFLSTLKRLRNLQEIVGHGNFSILNFEDGLRISRKYHEIGNFSKAEIEFMEKIFNTEAQQYGFYGQKPFKRITDRIKGKEIVKVPYTGNYLYKSVSIQTFKKIKKEVGSEIILTSGIRGIMKQFLLFLNKAYKSNGNLSLASRSIAPPGFSYHAVGDFDVGQTGFGIANFTEHFTSTNVYKRLSELGYLKLRYPQENLLGVRFEPWHIKL
jgi:hypothetical protein